MEFESLSEAEYSWLHDRIAQAALFVDSQAPLDLPSLASLDDAFEAFVNMGDAANARANDVVLAVGAAFGEHLVRTLGFEWRIATDEWGTDIAVLARPGRGDITIFPTDYVAKRWERREPRFLVASVGPILQTLQESAKAWGDA